MGGFRQPQRRRQTTTSRGAAVRQLDMDVGGTCQLAGVAEIASLHELAGKCPQYPIAGRRLVVRRLERQIDDDLNNAVDCKVLYCRVATGGQQRTYYCYNGLIIV